MLTLNSCGRLSVKKVFVWAVVKCRSFHTLKTTDLRLCIQRSFATRAQNSQEILSLNERKTGIGKKLRVYDNLPEGYNLIYKIPMSTTVGILHFSTWIMITSSVLLYIYLLYKKEINIKVEEGTLMSLANVRDTIICSIAVLQIVIVSLFFSHMSPIRIYRNKSHYVALFNRWYLPFSKYYYSFNSNSCKNIGVLKILYKIDNHKTVMLFESGIYSNIADWNDMFVTEKTITRKKNTYASKV